MKKITLLFSIMFLWAAGLNAQKDLRTTNTRIADILAQMPASDEASLNTAMKEMEGLGVNGLFQLCRQMVPGGNTDNSKTEFAIMGYTTYVSATGREFLKKEAEEAWIKALSISGDRNLTSFFMSMIEIIGSDRSVPPLVPFLRDSVLALKAAPVLASIGTAAAGKALLNALTWRTVPDKELLLQALGEMKYKPAMNQLTSYALKGNLQEKKAARHAIAEIGIPASARLMWNLTGKDGKALQDLDATADYAFYLQRLFENGFAKEAGNLASDFVRNASNSNVYAKTAALRSLVFIRKEKALPALAKAAYDKDLEYRGAALRMAAPLVNNSNVSLFTKNLEEPSPDVQTSLVGFLGNYQNPDLYKTILNFAGDSHNPQLKQTSIIALGRMSPGSVTNDLLSILKTNNETDIPFLEKAFLIVKDKNLTTDLLNELPHQSGLQKALLINILAAKEEKKAFTSIAQELHSNNQQIREAALHALPEVTGAQNIHQLLDMLLASKEADEISSIQNSIAAALPLTSDPEKMIMDRFNKVSGSQQSLLFPSLSFIGNKSAMKKVFEFYKNNSGDEAAKALKTLASWPAPDAMGSLFSIASGSNYPEQDRSQALDGFIRLIPDTHVPQSQQLLLLKKAMATAFTDKQKGQILDQAGRRMNSFSALAFAAPFMEDSALKQKAAYAVMNIGMSDKSFYGTLVRAWLTQSMNIISGQDDIYMKKAIQKFLSDMPQKNGYVSLFNGKDLTGWKGLVGNPITRVKMNPGQLAEAQEKANEEMRSGWAVKNGELIFTGKGDNIATIKKYGNFEMLIDWKIFNDGQKDGDAGIYLRGTPQVQIWDTSRRDVGAQVGSGGLYNNQKHRSTPLKVADNPLGDWNHFDIKMIGDRVTVYLNGELVTDNVPLENYWDRNLPLWPEEQIELQAHGSRIGYRDIYIRELPEEKPYQLSEEEKEEGFKVLFDGTNMDQWQGNLTDYVIKDGAMVVEPKPGSRGNLYTKKEYSDFDFRFEFKLTPGANNGVGIRTPLTGDAAYAGMEIQILDNTADIYKNLEKYQYHGSVYGVIPAKRGFLKPVGEWNSEEIIARGDRIQVILNGHKIVDGDIREASKNGTMDKRPHPGLLNKKGYIGFLGHGSVVYFRNIRIKELH